jgi:hypothetical protein
MSKLIEKAYPEAAFIKIKQDQGLSEPEVIQ